MGGKPPVQCVSYSTVPSFPRPEAHHRLFSRANNFMIDLKRLVVGSSQPTQSFIQVHWFPARYLNKDGSGIAEVCGQAVAMF